MNRPTTNTSRPPSQGLPSSSVAQSPYRSQPQPATPGFYASSPATSRAAVGSQAYPSQAVRGGPPGFGGQRSGAAESNNDFPALGTSHHPQSMTLSQYQQQQAQAQGTYASQAQTPTGSSQPPPHLQQLPPGILPLQHQMNGAQQANGTIGDNNSRRNDFPALGDVKDRYTSTNPSLAPSSPLHESIPNGTSTEPNGQSTEPMVVSRPVMQIMQSPVDRWGLKQLLYEIKMAKGDMHSLIFGEDLGEFGVDVSSDEALYPSFVTPWADPDSVRGSYVEDDYRVPPCYNVHAPPMATKLAAFTEETLFYAFYANPKDVIQLDVAAELFNRGWRYHKDMQVWLTPETPANSIEVEPGWLRGPFVVFDPRTFSRQKTADEFMLEAAMLEATQVPGPSVRLAQQQQQNGQFVAQQQQAQQLQAQQQQQQQGLRQPQAQVQMV